MSWQSQNVRKGLKEREFPFSIITLLRDQTNLPSMSRKDSAQLKKQLEKENRERERERDFGSGH